MKKLLCILISAVLLLTSVSAGFASPKTGLTFTVLADPHLQSLERTGVLTERENYSDTLAFFNATSQGQMTDISESLLSEFLSEFYASEQNILLVAGDLTVNGEKTDHTRFAQMLTRAAEKAKEAGLPEKRVYVINGNHDIVPDKETKMNTAEEFKTVYADFGYRNALTVDEASCSYTADLDSQYRLIALDSCVYGKDYGKMTKEKMNWLKEQVSLSKADGKIPLLMMHHSLLYHFPVQDMMEDCMKAAEQVADMGIHYVFTGHMHGNDIAEAVTKQGNKLYDIMTGSLITSPCSYRVVNFTKEAVNITTQYITSVDSSLLPQGLNETQTKLVTEDFPAYAEGFFTEGMKVWLYRYLGSAAKISQKLNIPEGSTLYNILDDMLLCVRNALELPLYNSPETPGAFDSYQEIVAAYGAELPQSEYATANELVGKVIGDFFRGDENISAQSPEIRLMYTVVSNGVIYALTEIAAGKYGEQAINALYTAVGARTGLLSHIPYTGDLMAKKALANTLVSLVLSPILEGVTVDAYTPGDLNVTLEGANALSAQAQLPSPLTVLQRILRYFTDFYQLLKKQLAIYCPARATK